MEESRKRVSSSTTAESTVPRGAARKNCRNYNGYNTLRTLMDGAGVTWKYYTPCFSAALQPGCFPSADCSGSKPNCNGSLLNAFDVTYPVRNGPEWGTNVSWPETNIFTAISNGTLPAVSWVIPEDANSDHPKQPCQCDDGPRGLPVW